MAPRVPDRRRRDAALAADEQRPGDDQSGEASARLSRTRQRHPFELRVVAHVVGRLAVRNLPEDVATIQVESPRSGRTGGFVSGNPSTFRPPSPPWPSPLSGLPFEIPHVRLAGIGIGNQVPKVEAGALRRHIHDVRLGVVCAAGPVRAAAARAERQRSLRATSYGETGRREDRTALVSRRHLQRRLAQLRGVVDQIVV